MGAENPARFHRRSIRLQAFDYTSPGAYFFTICTHDRIPLFGVIRNGRMDLNDAGRIVLDEWNNTGIMRPRIGLDAFVVMPDHVHGILVLNDVTDDGGCRRGTLQRAPTDTTTVHNDHARERFGKPVSDSVPTIIRLFKSSVTARVNTLYGRRGQPVWQRGYHERVIRDDEEWERIRRYIDENPRRWKDSRGRDSVEKDEHEGT